MNLTVTGADGFVGRHVIREAAKQGIAVTAITRSEHIDSTLSPFISRHLVADLTVEWPEIEESDAIIHLAGLADVGRSFDEPLHYLSTNAAFAVQLGETLARQDRLATRVVFVSTGGVYAPNGAVPITEAHSIYSTSPYAASKIAYEQLASYYASRGLDAIIARPFNHIGPGQGAGFIVPDLARKITGAREETDIEVGNLGTSRDYSDVRDVALAYLLLAQVPNHEHLHYNIASGRSVTGHEIFDVLWRELRPADSRYNPRQIKLRPVDNPYVVGDSSRLRNEFGWRPKFTIDQSIRDFIAEN